MNAEKEIRDKLSNWRDKSCNEEIYRIMDAIKGNESAMLCLLNLVNKVDREHRANVGLKKQVENLQRKTERIWV